MGAVFVVSPEGERLMPTFNKPKVRKMLKNGKAVIFQHHPFTIQLTYNTAHYTQDMEFCTDCGYAHDGISVKSEKHEYARVQADMLDNSKKMHDERRKNRRNRRNRKRYRKPRFNNRIKNKKKGWIPPSLKDRLENQVRLFALYNKVCPLMESTAEVGAFDTQVLEAVEQGKPVPEGGDYQHGPRYGFDTLREAVFHRDGYKCALCGKTPFDTPDLITVLHHVLYWKGDHTDRMASLITLCTNCHTTANHQKDGPLWGMEPDEATSNKAGAAFMNTVRWMIRDRMAETAGIPVKITYGALTKRTRKNLNIEKSHTNDAYCIGRFRPIHRTQEEHIEKRRRNDRILEKFHDAVYIDSRDGSEKTGKELSSDRTKRKEPRHGPNNLRPFRKEKVTKGNRAIRRQRYDIRPGDEVIYNKKTYTVHGTQNNGKTLSLDTIKIVQLSELTPKKAKDGTEVPVKEGQRLALKGKKEKHEVLSINGATVTMRWYMGVKPEKVRRVTCSYGGWRAVQ